MKSSRSLNRLQLTKSMEHLQQRDLRLVDVRDPERVAATTSWFGNRRYGLPTASGPPSSSRHCNTSPAGRVMLGVGTGGVMHGTEAWEAVGAPTPNVAAAPTRRSRSCPD